MKNRKRSFLCFILAIIMIAAMLPFTAAADPVDGGEGERGWKDNVYVLGTLITEENCEDVLGDGGSVKYDFEYQTLTLTNATLNLKDYDFPINSNDPESGNNYVAGINAWGEINIDLKGENRIYSETADYAADKEYVYGISAQDTMNIRGIGTLEIAIYTENDKITFYGIDSGRNLVVNGPFLNIQMPGSGKSTGIDAFWDGITLEGGSEIHIYTGGKESTALYDSSFGKSQIAEGSVLELISENRALNYIMLHADVTNLGALVNPEATSKGAFEWDRTTRLSQYKYVRFPSEAERSDQEVAGVINQLLSLTEKSTPAEAESAVLAYINLSPKQKATVLANKTAREKLEFAKKKAMEPQPVDLSKAAVTLNKTEVVFNGKEQKPGVASVKVANMLLKEGTDFEVSYKDNIHAGTATVFVKGKGFYQGTASTTFKIGKAKNKITKVTKAKAFKASALKKKAKSFRIAATVKGKASKGFKLVSVSKKAKKYVKVSKTGKVTLKKGLKKGTYKLKVKITAKATNDYKAATATKTIKIRVK